MLRCSTSATGLLVGPSLEEALNDNIVVVASNSVEALLPFYVLWWKICPNPPSSLPAPGLRTCSPAEPKAVGMGNSHSERGSLGVMVRRASPSAVP